MNGPRSKPTTPTASDALVATLTSLVNGFPGLAYRCGVDGSAEFISAGVESLTGYAADEFTSGRRQLSDLVHPDDHDRRRARVEDLVAHARPMEITYRVRRADGETRWVREVAQAVSDASGLVIAVEGFVTDITEPRKQRQRIEQLNRVYSVLSGINHIIVREKQPHAILDAACQLAVDKGGFRMAWVGKTDSQKPPWRLRVTAHSGADTATLDIVEALVGGERPACEFTYDALRTGRCQVCNDIATSPQAVSWRSAALERNYLSMASLPLTEDGEVIGTLNLYADEADFFDAEELQLLQELATDVSFALQVRKHDADRRRIERRLRETEVRFSEVAEAIHEVFWITGPDSSDLVFVSPAYEKIWGRSCQALYDGEENWSAAIVPEDRARVVEALRTKLESGKYDETYRIHRPDGELRWIHDRAFLIRGDDGEIVRVVGTAQDITQRRELEHQFRQAQKLDPIGQLAGGVAHDFNNILAAIVMQADFASQEHISPAERRKLLSEIRASSDRAATLTRQLLALSSRQILQPHRLNLNELVEGITAMLRRILGEHISVSVDLHPDPLFTRADAGMIDQVLLNLAVNARDAMPSGGQLTISTSVCDLSQESAASIQGASAGRHVQLVVRDTGEGIAPDTLPRIFEPFFTTKPQGKGTGLGLATVYGIVKQHEGGLSVESEPGRGTTFRILLKTEDVASEDSSPHASPATPRRGAETILLVEDDDQVRRLMRRVLERHGYTVLTARDGPQALSTFERHAGEIELLFSDIVMPGGLSGRQLAEECQRKKPSLRVIFTSGFSPDFGGRDLSLAPGQHFIQKPTPSRELLSVVRQTLDS